MQGRVESPRSRGWADSNSFSMGAGQADEEGSTRLAVNDQLLLYFYTELLGFFSLPPSSVKLYLEKTGCPTLMAVSL